MSKFSIIIPVYKVEPYLDQCVQSVVSQTFPDYEILLVDDGSPDSCGAMCDRWATRDSRIRVLHQKNQGLSGARNTGIREARGEYVMFLDSDDWWEDAFVLEKVARYLEGNPVDVLSFNYRKSFGGEIGASYFPDSLPTSDTAENLEQILCRDRWITGACNKAVRRLLLTERELHFRTGITSEDIDWTLRLGLEAETFAFANICVFIYRQHGESLSHSTCPRKTEHLCANVQFCVRLLETAEPEKAELLKPFAAYQYGTLLHNVANLSPVDRTLGLMSEVREMRWLLNHSPNRKVRLLRLSNRIAGFSGMMLMLRLRQKLLERLGKGV